MADTDNEPVKSLPVALTRLLTPAGVAALVPLVILILGGIDTIEAKVDASCAAAKQNGYLVAAVIGVDSELSSKRNTELRELLLKQSRQVRCAE